MRRVLLEGDDLARKLAALREFTGSDAFKALDPTDAHLLVTQAEIMQAYLHLLTIRLNRSRVMVQSAAMRGPLSTGKLDVN